MNVKELTEKFKQLIWWIVQITIGHNPDHSTTITVFNKKMQVCSRCFGLYLGLAVFAPAFWLISFRESYGFWYIFCASWILALFSIVDWVTVKAGLWKGDNAVRMLTGFMLGLGGMLYLFLLPIPSIYRIITLWGYGLIFTVVHYAVKCKEFNLSLKNPIHQNLVAMGMIVPLSTGGCGLTGGCGQGCTVCPCANACGCACSPCMCCVCMCPMICFVKKYMDGKKKQ